MSSPLKGENVNLLDESEWRLIHNALSHYQSVFRNGITTDSKVVMRSKCQKLMDKVRNNYITPYVLPDGETK
jgi:hypothetical protein